jgi:hypothetical protein
VLLQFKNEEFLMNKLFNSMLILLLVLTTSCSSATKRNPSSQRCLDKKVFSEGTILLEALNKLRYSHSLDHLNSMEISISEGAMSLVLHISGINEKDGKSRYIKAMVNQDCRTKEGIRVYDIEVK